MDKISVLGLVLGIVAIVGGQVLEGGHVGSLSQPTALLIVLGGTMGAVMLQSPYATFIRGVKMVRWVWYPPVVDHQQLIKQIASWSQVSRREGLLALENGRHLLAMAGAAAGFAAIWALHPVQKDPR